MRGDCVGKSLAALNTSSSGRQSAKALQWDIGAALNAETISAFGDAS